MNDKSSPEARGYDTGGWRAHYVLIVCTLLYIVNYMDRQVFAVILQPMKIDLGLTDALGGGTDGFATGVMLVMLFGLTGISAGFLFLVASRTYPEDLKKVQQEAILAE